MFHTYYRVRKWNLPPLLHSYAVKGGKFHKRTLLIAAKHCNCETKQIQLRNCHIPKKMGTCYVNKQKGTFINHVDMQGERGGYQMALLLHKPY